MNAAITVDELKKYSRPRRFPRDKPLKIEPPLIRREMDFPLSGVRYKVTSRSKKHPLTHWTVTPLSSKGRDGRPTEPLDLESKVIIEALATQDASRADIPSFSRIANGNYGRDTSHNSSKR